MYRHIGKLAAIAALVGGLAACTSPTAPASTQSVSARQAEPGDVRHEPQPGDKHREPEPGDNRGRHGNDDPAGHH